MYILLVKLIFLLCKHESFLKSCLLVFESKIHFFSLLIVNEFKCICILSTISLDFCLLNYFYEKFFSCIFCSQLGKKILALIKAIGSIHYYEVLLKFKSLPNISFITYSDVFEDFKVILYV